MDSDSNFVTKKESQQSEQYLEMNATFPFGFRLNWRYKKNDEVRRPFSFFFVDKIKWFLSAVINFGCRDAQIAKNGSQVQIQE